jgi:hypothetical protein
MDPKPKAYLDPLETTTLLNQVTEHSNHNPKTTPVGTTFRYQNPSDPGGPRFQIRPAVYLNELTWGDVAVIAEALLGFYERYEMWLEMAFLIEDTERAAIGSGIVEEGERKVRGWTAGVATS